MECSSKESQASVTMNRCSSCDIAEGDGIKLKTCAACKSVRYCSVKCQKKHRPKHKRDCRKRAAELRDEILFKQPESSHFGDCPICFLPISIEKGTATLMSCCSKIICQGCEYRNQKRQVEENQVRTCAFCRSPSPKTTADSEKILTDRAMKLNDVVAIREVGIRLCFKGDFKKGFAYLSKAAEMGDVVAQNEVGKMYDFGYGVEKDVSKAVPYYEKAAIGGNPFARHALAIIEIGNERLDRAVLHLIIASKLGNKKSLQVLRCAYEDGSVSKEEFEATLRRYQDVVDATKSAQREEAANFRRSSTWGSG